MSLNPFRECGRGVSDPVPEFAKSGPRPFAAPFCEGPFRTVQEGSGCFGVEQCTAWGWRELVVLEVHLGSESARHGPRSPGLG